MSKLAAAGRPLRVLTVFGTRPEAIKMAPLVAELRRREGFLCAVCVTAQHRELLDLVNAHFGIVPDFDFNVMQQRQSLCGIASRVITGLDGVLRQWGADLVLVHGDTTTTAAAALAAFYSHVPVGHVEAGLRTYDKDSPFPEEGNRLVTGQLARLHFAPTARNAACLKKENITDNVFVTGNTVIDALAYTVKKDYVFSLPQLGRLPENGRFVVVTAHRRENLGQPLQNICTAVRQLAEAHPDTLFLYPVHPNPAVRQPVEALLGNIPNVWLLPPLDTADMHNLLARCRFVMTDSGGLQEEAPALGRPVLVLRRETERPEAVSAGTAKLCGIQTQDIFSAADTLLRDEAAWRVMAQAVNPYGDGQACRRIADAIEFVFGLREAPPTPFGGEAL